MVMPNDTRERSRVLEVDETISWRGSTITSTAVQPLLPKSSPLRLDTILFLKATLALSPLAIMIGGLLAITDRIEAPSQTVYFSTVEIPTVQYVESPPSPIETETPPRSSTTSTPTSLNGLTALLEGEVSSSSSQTSNVLPEVPLSTQEEEPSPTKPSITTSLDSSESQESSSSSSSDSPDTPQN